MAHVRQAKLFGCLAVSSCSRAGLVHSLTVHAVIHATIRTSSHRHPWMHGTAGDGVGGCCSGTGTGAPPPSSAEEAATHALIEDLRGAALDPTLDQCCQRDLRDRIAAERVRASLQARDRIDARTREAAGAIIRDPARIAAVAAATAAAANAAVIDADCTEDDADEAGELHALRQARLRELRAAAAATAGGGAGAAGYGALNEAAEGQLLALLREPPGRGNLVVHLAVQGHAPCDALDELLATAAAQYRCAQRGLTHTNTAASHY